jgi:fructokinase
VAYLGAISTDFFGEHLITRLRDNGVSVDLIRRVANPTTLAFVSKASDGSASYAFYTNDTADRAISHPMLPEGLPDGAILQIGSISLIPDGSGDALVRLAEASSADHIVAVDPNVRPNLAAAEGVEPEYRARLDRTLGAASIVKTSDEDLSWIRPGSSPEQAARDLIASGVRLVILTEGPRGATAYLPRAGASGESTAAGETGTASPVSVHVDAVPVDVVDTIGAGDSFLGACLAWLEERRITSPVDLATIPESAVRDMLGFAARVSSFTCSREGAEPPTRGELSG